MYKYFVLFLLLTSCSNVYKINKLISNTSCIDTNFNIDRSDDLKLTFKKYRKLLLLHSLDSLINDSISSFFLAETYNDQIGVHHLRVWNSIYDSKLLVDIVNKKIKFFNANLEVQEYGIPEVIAVDVKSKKMRKIESMIDPKNVPELSPYISGVYRFKLYRIFIEDNKFKIECNYLMINPFDYFKR